MLKGRDQARADAEQAEGALDRLGQALKTFASQARRRIRTETGGYRRDHLRALAQRIEDAKEVRIMGSKRAPARGRRRIERKNGRFWSAQIVARHGQ